MSGARSRYRLAGGGETEEREASADLGAAASQFDAAVGRARFSRSASESSWADTGRWSARQRQREGDDSPCAAGADGEISSGETGKAFAPGLGRDERSGVTKASSREVVTLGWEIPVATGADIYFANKSLEGVQVSPTSFVPDPVLWHY